MGVLLCQCRSGRRLSNLRFSPVAVVYAVWLSVALYNCQQGLLMHSPGFYTDKFWGLFVDSFRSPYNRIYMMWDGVIRLVGQTTDCSTRLIGEKARCVIVWHRWPKLIKQAWVWSSCFGQVSAPRTWAWGQTRICCHCRCLCMRILNDLTRVDLMT